MKETGIRETGMETDFWQKGWIRALTTALVIGMMALIFCFSMENAEKSDTTSGRISGIVIRMLYPGYPGETAERQQEIYDAVQFAVRKTAHFTEYLILGLLMRFCFLSWFGRKAWLELLSWGAGTLYAVTDELHQLTIDGRSGQWTDVLLDSAGVLAGVLTAKALARLIGKKAGGKA